MYRGISHDRIMVIGSGWSIKQHSDKIRQLIQDRGMTTIGINAMTSLCSPDFHLWTNRKQFARMGKCIRPDKSQMMFGWKIPKNIIRKHYKGNYIPIVYSNSDQPFVLSEKHIKGRFRTAGCLGIAIAYLMDAREILVAGMDGFTLYGQKDILGKRRHQHCYGLGHTDDADWEDCIEKDNIVSRSLDRLSEHFDFKIITPTKFIKHYNGLYLTNTEK